MSVLLEKVAAAREHRAEAEAEFRLALAEAKELHSWAEIAEVAGVSIAGVRYLARNLNAQRRGKAVAS
jgi:hypothetical protein